jgi:SNF2 family DNA or RNA helicase
MGLGKSAQVIRAVSTLLDTKPSAKVLLVVPSVLRLQWKREFALWDETVMVEIASAHRRERQRSYLLPYPVTVMSYEQLRSDGDGPTRTHYDLVVLDEAQRIKNPDSSLHQSVLQLDRERSWAITGTPLENSIEDLVSISNFLSYGRLHLGMTAAEIKERLSSLMLRRTKQDVAPELPPIIDQTVVMRLEGPQLDEYAAAENDIHDNLVLGPTSNTARLFSYIHRLKQICNRDSSGETSVKWEMLTEVLDHASESGSKVIVASQYVQTLKWLSSRIVNTPRYIYSGELSESHGASLGWRTAWLVLEFPELWRCSGMGNKIRFGICQMLLKGY